ncbi:hypothetical protein [[Collinsella] massiliensis]|uniref:Uncharacterized protein n=1 Tax=[Collinsella] massiliensis TaxID=1232426 RepID=A0A1Y3XSH4_9ACTN|nr:hypothetical protein [[Collinsella] massiliensis]OUN88455.1 hypothetical protein B5G02_06660 [[Collinsella] massiliensis]
MEDLSGLLKKAADDYAAALGELDYRVQEKAFSKGSFFSEARVDGCNQYKTVRDALIDAGTVLLDDEEQGIALAMLKGGAGGMAPVLLLAKVEGNEVSLGAYSKEGLIRQHAAKKAVESLKKNLQGTMS